MARGYYWLPDRDAERWQHRYTLSLARAVVAQRTQLSTAYLSHTSAALALELDMFSQEPDVYLAVSSAPNQVHTVLPRIWVPARGTPSLISEGPSDSSWTARCFSDSACFVLQAAFFRSRKSLSASSGVRYPRAE